MSTLEYLFLKNLHQSQKPRASKLSLAELFSKALPKRSFNAPVMPQYSKHQASKKGAKHFHKYTVYSFREPIPTQHQRVVIGRIARDKDYLKKVRTFLNERDGVGTPLA